jgi:hypothetical protein
MTSNISIRSIWLDTLRFFVLWVLFVGSTSSTMIGFDLWDCTKSCMVCVGLMYDEPLLIYKVFMWISMSIFVELARTLLRWASLASVLYRSEEPLVLKCYCTCKKVCPLYIWTRLIVSYVVFPHFPVILVTMLFTILSLTVYLWSRTEEPLVLKWCLPVSCKGVPNGSQIASLGRIPFAIKKRDQIASCKLPLWTP